MTESLEAMFLSAFYLYLFTFFIMGLFEVYSLLDLEPVKASGIKMGINILIFMEDMP